MRWLRAEVFHWGLRPQTPRIYRISARMIKRRRPLPPPAIPAAESALGLRPRSALSPFRYFRVDDIDRAVQ